MIPLQPGLFQTRPSRSAGRSEWVYVPAYSFPFFRDPLKSTARLHGPSGGRMLGVALQGFLGPPNVRPYGLAARAGSPSLPAAAGDPKVPFQARSPLVLPPSFPKRVARVPQRIDSGGFPPGHVVDFTLVRSTLARRLLSCSFLDPLGVCPRLFTSPRSGFKVNLVTEVPSLLNISRQGGQPLPSSSVNGNAGILELLALNDPQSLSCELTNGKSKISASERGCSRCYTIPAKGGSFPMGLAPLLVPSPSYFPSVVSRGAFNLSRGLVAVVPRRSARLGCLC